jgi:hypothetical protein
VFLASSLALTKSRLRLLISIYMQNIITTTRTNDLIICDQKIECPVCQCPVERSIPANHCRNSR